MTPELIQRLTAIGSTLLTAIIFLMIAYRFGYFSYRKKDEFAELTFIDVVGAFFTFLASITIIGPIILMLYYTLVEHRTLAEMRGAGEESEAWLGIFNNIILFAMLAIYSFMKWEKVKTFFGKGPFFHDFLIGILTWLISLPLASLVGEIADLFLSSFRERAVDQTAVLHLKQAAMHPSLFLATAFMVVTIVPFVEELLFRGYLQTWLRQKIGYKGAIVATSVIFSLFHFSSSQQYDNVLILTILFTVSCFMGFVYERQKSLFASFGMHAMFNAVTTFSIFLSS